MLQNTYNIKHKQNNNTLEWLKGYAITMRPYLMFISGITGIAGIAFADSISPIQGGLIFLASFLSYGFGQALTDCFQIDTDSISSPYRPLTQGTISRNFVLFFSWSGLTVCIAILTYYYSFNLVLGILSGAGLASYTYFKKKWWSGPFYNAFIVGVLFIMCFSAATREAFSSKQFLAFSTVFWGYANFVLTGYFKDIEADKATGYYTFPVVFGRKYASLVSDVFALFFLASGIFSVSFENRTYIEKGMLLLFLLPGIWLTIKAQILLHKNRTDKEAHVAIKPVIQSYVLILSAMAMSYSMSVFTFLFLILFYSSFLTVLKFRPEKGQI